MLSLCVAGIMVRWHWAEPELTYTLPDGTPLKAESEGYHLPIVTVMPLPSRRAAPASTAVASYNGKRGVQ
jgi:hypothetical protein